MGRTRLSEGVTAGLLILRRESESDKQVQYHQRIVGVADDNGDDDDDPVDSTPIFSVFGSVSRWKQLVVVDEMHPSAVVNQQDAELIPMPNADVDSK